MWLIVLEWAIVSAALACAVRWPWSIPAALLVLGSRQHALMVLGHEGTHGGLWRDRRVNDWITNLFCFWPMFVDLHSYRTFHLLHHKHLGHPHLDPELCLKARFSDRWSDPSPDKLRRLVVRDLLGLHWREVMTVADVFRGRYTAIRVAYLGVIIATLLAFGLWAVPVLWMVSLFTTQFAVQRLRMWREHVGTDSTLSIPSTFIERLVYLPHGVWRHEEHHR